MLFRSNYSGKTDPNGFYIGKDICGSNLIVDLDRRAEDKTNANVLIPAAVSRQWQPGCDSGIDRALE